MDDQEIQDSPELTAAKQEHSEIMTNKNHPMNAAYRGMDLAAKETVMKHIDDGYKKAGATGKVQLDGTRIIPIGADSDGNIPADRESVLAPLRDEWGVNFPANYSQTQEAARMLFPPGQEKFFEQVAGAVSAEIGEVGAIRLLFDISQKMKGR